MRKTKSHIVWEGEAHQLAHASGKYFGGNSHYPELISEEELKIEQQRLSSFVRPMEILLPEGYIPAPGQAKMAKGRVREIAEAIRSLVAAFLEWLSPKQKRRLLTSGGKRALSELTLLWELYFATSAADGMDMVGLEVAFGQAYFGIMAESKRQYGAHRGRRHHEEDYAPYMEHFARAASNLA